MTVFLWLLLLSILGFCTWWHVTENRKLESQWRKEIDTDFASWLVRFAWMRSLQLLVAMACATVVVIAYDWRLAAARDEVREFAAIKSELLQLKEDATTPAATAKATSTNTATSYYPPVTTAPKTQPSGNTVIDVYSPEQTGNDVQAAMDRIKKRYEDILITYFFLNKCNRAQQTDFHIITSALSQEMASVNAPGRLQNDIVTAARGSYREMYAGSSCQGPGIDTLYTQYVTYVASLSKNFIPE